MITRNTYFRVLSSALGPNFKPSADEIARDPLLNVNEVIVVHGDQLASRDWRGYNAKISVSAWWSFLCVNWHI